MFLLYRRAAAFSQPLFLSLREINNKPDEDKRPRRRPLSLGKRLNRSASDMSHISYTSSELAMNDRFIFYSFGTSHKIASPWPPQLQIAATPKPPPRRFNS